MSQAETDAAEIAEKEKAKENAMGARVCVLDIRAPSARKRLRVITPRLPRKSSGDKDASREAGGAGGAESKMVHDFVSLAFSGDASLLVMCSGGPEFCVFVYDWFRSRMLCCQSMRMTVTKVSFNPVDPAKIAVNGTKTLRVWKTQSKGFKAMPHLSGARGDVEYTDHIWTSVPSKSDFAAAEGKEDVGSLHYMARAASWSRDLGD